MNLYFYAPYWYGYLNTVAYWWEDEAHTTPAKRLPTSSDTAHILSDAFYGTCNAGLTIVKQGIEFGKWGATATGDLQVAQLGDYWGYEYGFKRIKIGNGNWIGPKRYYFVVEDDESSSSSCSSSSCHHDHNNNSSLSGEPDLGNPANWRTSPGGTSGGNVPGPSDIGILCNENSSSYSQGPSVSAYGTCNAGLLFNTYNAGYSTDWSSVLDGAVINGAMIERSALSSHSTFNGPYFARDVVSPGRLSYYYYSDLSSNAFNGQTFIHNDPDGVGYYSNMDPGYWLSNDMFSHAMFNGDLAVGGAMIIPPDVAKRVFSRGNRLSIDLGKTWLYTLSTVPFCSTNDVRFGVDRGDAQKGLCHVPTPEQVQKGVLSDVSGVGTLAATVIGSGTGGLTPDEHNMLVDIRSKTSLIGTGQGIVQSPVDCYGSQITVIRGDDYTPAAKQVLEWTDPGNWPNLSAPGVIVKFKIQPISGGDAVPSPNLTASLVNSNPQVVRVQLTHADTSQLVPSWPNINTHRFTLEATLSGGAGTVRTLAMGLATIVNNIP